MRFNRFLHLIAFAGKAHRGSPASGGLTTKMPDGGAPSQAMSQPDFSPYLPLSGDMTGTVRCAWPDCVSDTRRTHCEFWGTTWAECTLAELESDQTEGKKLATIIDEEQANGLVTGISLPHVDHRPRPENRANSPAAHRSATIPRPGSSGASDRKSILPFVPDYIAPQSGSDGSTP